MNMCGHVGTVGCRGSSSDAHPFLRPTHSGCRIGSSRPLGASWRPAGAAEAGAETGEAAEKVGILVAGGEGRLHRVDFVFFFFTRAWSHSQAEVHHYCHTLLNLFRRWRQPPISTVSSHFSAGGGVPLGRRGPYVSPARLSS